MEDILINITPQETRVAVLLAGVVQELHVERSAMRGLVGNIYLGRVARVLPGMQSAFIDIGLERAAFLHVADIWEFRQFTQEKPPPIERLIHEGDTLLVQVVKDPDRNERRAAVDAGQPCRPDAGLPAAGSAHRDLAAHRGRGRARAVA
jgi:Ribonuclease G/E